MSVPLGGAAGRSFGEMVKAPLPALDPFVFYCWEVSDGS